MIRTPLSSGTQNKQQQTENINVRNASESIIYGNIVIVYHNFYYLMIYN